MYIVQKGQQWLCFIRFKPAWVNDPSLAITTPRRLQAEMWARSVDGYVVFTSPEGFLHDATS